MGKERDEQLITNAAVMALSRRRPAVGLIHHSDQGSQYTSQGYQKLLHQYGILISMSGKGDCYDNALMESFFGTRHARSALNDRSLKLDEKRGMLSLNTLKCFTIVSGNIHL
jgi:putative transposase